MSRLVSSVGPVLLLALAASGCKTTGGPGDPDDDGEPGVAPFFLPTAEPDNTSAPTIEVDSKGNLHAVYPAYAGGDAYYAFCAKGCAGPEDVSVVVLETDATTANAMIAIDGDDVPHVLLSTFDAVYYAVPNGDPSQASSWSSARILDHDGDREVTGEAFALDPSGRPRFMMHTYVAYLGVGQKTPESHFVTCDSDCLEPSSWTSSMVSNQIWESSTLRFDENGVAHLATVAHVVDEQGSTTLLGAYVRCANNCTEEISWVGTGLLPAYQNEVEAVTINPTISMVLTPNAEPRIAMLAEGADFAKQLVYFACDTGCTDSDAWTGSILSDSSDLGAGLDLALDGASPRIAYTFDYNIGIAFCDAGDCTAADAPWDLTKVEISSEMDPDEIFLEENCNVGAWFLHSPSLALDAEGNPLVGYQARDISGGWSNPDPTKPDCVAGTDMTWSRLAILGGLE